MTISIKTEDQIAIMREGGKKLAEIMRAIEVEIQPGVDTLQLDKLAEELVLDCGGKPAFKGYGDKHNPFPGTLCVSLNDEVVHGIPKSEIVLSDGDILKIDIGMEYKGFFTDMARTFAVGDVSAQARKLMEVAEESFWKGVKTMKDGSMLSAYSKAVEAHVKKNGFSVVRNLVGHGIGKNLHEAPQVLNYFEPRARDVILKEGMTLALEPMINAGNHKTMLAEDEWTYVTADGTLSAHYENTVLVTKKGVEILTK